MEMPFDPDAFSVRWTVVLRRATAVPPKTAAAACRVAGLQLRLGDLAAARATIQAARDRFPQSWLLWKFEALINLEERGPKAPAALEAAIACFRRAAELADRLRVRADLLLSVGICLGHCGQRDEELSVYRQVIEMMPHNAPAHLYCVQCQPLLNANDQLAAKIAALIDSSQVDRLEKRHLHYALGHLYDRSGDPATAFRHFKQANYLRAGITKRTDLNALQSDVEARKAHFRREVIEKYSQYGNRELAPIFVVGMPRSGTTLIEQILSLHSAVVGVGERVDIFRAAQRMPSVVQSGHPYPLCLDALSEESVRALASPIVNEFQSFVTSGERVVTKRPEDFWDLGLIAILFPKARIVHCRRHPIDACFSCYMQDFVGIRYATSLDDLAAVYRLYVEIMAHWRTVLPGSMLHDVSYEELVCRPEERIRHLLEFCGLTFEESCLRFHETQRRVDSASRWQVRRPLSAASLHRWQRYKEFLGPLLPLESLR
jgi:tetratricopeptide (TPR) repeat protein